MTDINMLLLNLLALILVNPQNPPCSKSDPIRSARPTQEVICKGIKGPLPNFLYISDAYQFIKLEYSNGRVGDRLAGQVHLYTTMRSGAF